MKEAYIATKEKAERSVNANENTAEEYAADKVQSGIDEISHDVVYAFDKAGRKGVRETKRNIQSAKDGFQHFKQQRAEQSLRKQTAQNTNSAIKTVDTAEKTITIGKFFSKKTIKFAGKEVFKKTTQKSVKTAEQTAKAAIKTSQQTAKAAQKTAQATVKASQKAAQAAKATAKATATAVKAAAKATIAAVKAIIAAAKSCCCNSSRRLGCRCCDYSLMPCRVNCRFCLRHFLFGRRFRYGNVNADCCAGNQSRIR